MAITDSETRKWMNEENERRKQMQIRVKENDAKQKEREKYPVLKSTEIVGKTICKNCGNQWNVIEGENKKLIICGRRNFEETMCGCGDTLSLSQLEINRLLSSGKIMFIGNSFTQHAPYTRDGLTFYPRVVYPVSNDIFERFSRFRDFIVVDEIKRDVMDYPIKTEQALLYGVSGESLVTPLSGDMQQMLQNTGVEN